MKVVAENEVAFHLNPVWSAVWAMSLCAMVLVASEFLPVSLLTPIASDLHITEGHAGQSISISGLFALVTSLFLPSSIGSSDRRRVLLFFTAIMGVSGTMVALAPNARVLMVGRAIIGICIGGFWSMSAATIMRLVPDESVPKALAILNGGNALATTVAAPLGSLLGGIIGWRGAFFCVVPLVVVALGWQYVTLPSLPARFNHGQKTNMGNVFRLLADGKVALGMVSVMLFFMGQFGLFTYLRPFLEGVTGVNVEELSIVLLGMGVSGLAGTYFIGNLLEKRLYSILIFTPLFMALIGTALILFGSSLPVTALLICAWGFFATSAPVAWWTWLSKTLPDEAEAGGGLMVAMVQLAITMGAAVGGVFFDTKGYQSTFLFSIAILGGASVMAGITGQYQKKRQNQAIQGD